MTFFAVLFLATKTLEIPLFQAFFTLLLVYLSQQNYALHVACLDMQNGFAVFLFTETNPRCFLHLLVNGNISTYSFNKLVQTSGSLSLTKSAIFKNSLQSIKSNVSTMFLLITLLA